MRANVLVKTLNLPREDWLEWRKKGMGGSEIAKICGVSRFGNALTVYAEKTGRSTEPDEDNEILYWGRTLEEVVAKEFVKRNGLKVRRVNSILQHPDYPWALANIDRLIVSPEGVLECKAPGFWTGKDWFDDEGEAVIPDEYLLQVQWYLGVMGLPYGYAAGLLGGQKYVDVRVERDDELIAYLFKIAGDFWQMVQDRQIPAVDVDGKLTGLNVEFDPPKVILPSDLTPKIDRFQDLKAQIKPLDKEAEGLKKELHQIMELADPECELFLCDERQLKRGKATTNRFDQKAFKEECPDEYRKWVKPSISRRLTIK